MKPCAPETLTKHQATQHHIPENPNPQENQCKNFKSCLTVSLSISDSAMAYNL